MSLLEDEAVVLFQGDSITDGGRDRTTGDDLGRGYAMIAAAWFQARYPEKRVRFLNRGVGGNRIPDLRARWQTDCLELRPSWLSILIGINETWRGHDQSDPTSPEAYEAGYRALLDSVTGPRSGIQTRLILGEPFVLPVSADRDAWRADLDPKIAVVRKLAREYQAILVPYDGIFAQAATRREPTFWAADGVHPSPAGHALMAQSWLRAVQAI